MTRGIRLLLGALHASLALWWPCAASAGSVDSTRISLPSGPASIEGLGKNFIASLASGSTSYGVDIEVPPAAGGLAPNLSLEYDGGGGVSELGLGWRIRGLPSIRRRVDEGLPRFDASDTFEFSGFGAPSELVDMTDGYFRPRHESGSFARLQRTRDDRWEARLKSGVILRFGGDGFTEHEAQRAATYLLREELDLNGHSIRYHWDTSDGRGLLTGVTWNDYSDDTRQRIVLSYEVRPDPQVSFSAGIRQTLSRRLKGVEVTLGGALVRRYVMHYGEGRHSLLKSVELIGSDEKTALPSLSFGYTEASLTRDGRAVTMREPPPRTPGDKDVSIVDLNGDALPDLLVTEPGAFRAYLNHDGRSWRAAQDWGPANSPSVALSSRGVQLADLDGDGALDLVVKSGSDFRFLPGLDATRFSSAVAIQSVPSFTFEDPDVKLADLDGDRRSDAVITSPTGLEIAYNLGGTNWSPPELVGEVDPIQPLRFSDGRTQLCDVNGDRVLDFCQLRPGGMLYWLGRGRGVFEAGVDAENVPHFEATDPWKLVDLDGDGWVDLLHVSVHQLEYALAINAGVFDEPAVIPSTPEKTATTAIEFADMNGTGTTDIVWIDVSGSPAESWRYLELFPQGRGGLLTTIDNSLGKVTNISYGTAAEDAAAARDTGQPWPTRINVAMPVVRQVAIDSALGDPLQVTQYFYRHGTWDPEDRTFAGFAEGIQTELGDQYTPTLVTVSTFETGLKTRTLRGRILVSEARDASGLVFARTSNTYTATNVAVGNDDQSIEYAYQNSERIDHVEGLSNTRTTLSEWVQDDYGNEVEERRWGEVVGLDLLIGHDEALTRRTFANNVDEWVLGRLATEERCDAAGTRVGGKRNYYDGEAFKGLSLGIVERGNLTRQELWVGPGEQDFQLDVATRFNADGQPVETVDARGGGRVFEWDGDDHTTLVSEQVKLESDVLLIELAETDRRFGNLTKVTEYNGQSTSFRYDPLGRLVEVYKPGDPVDAPSIKYTYVVTAPLSRVITESRVWSGRDLVERSEILVDGLGRKRGSLSVDDERRWVLGSVGLYDARGNIQRELRPRFVTAEQAAAPQLLEDGLGTSSWRDALGRELGSRSQGGTETRHEYRPLLELGWDGGQTDLASTYEHLPTEKLKDGLGRIVQVTRYLEGAAVSALFSYDAADRLTARKDPEGHVAHYEYDGQGRRTLVDDPDLGRRGLIYDQTGNLIERHNPDGMVLRYTFDLAGRSLTEDWNDDGDPEVTRHWDVAPEDPNNLFYRGKLAATEEPSGRTAHEYDARGRVVETIVTIDGWNYASGSRYDNLDRESLHVYPDGSSIQLRRNLRGQLSGYGEAVQVEYDVDGLELERRFNTGFLQRYGYDQDRRLTEMEASAASGASVEHLEWSFDGSGNVKSLTDLRPNLSGNDRSEAYSYDNLYRLTSVSGSWGRTDWSYSASGNLLARLSTVDGQGATTIRYGEGAGPHAMTTVDDRSLEYDALGRLRADGRRSYTWNAADQLTTVTSSNGASVESVFDGDGKRRVRVERSTGGSTETVHFVSPWSEVRNGTLVRYVVHGDRRIARLSDNNGVPASSPPVEGPRLPGIALALRAVASCALAMALLSALLWLLRRRPYRSFARATFLLGCLVLACPEHASRAPDPPVEEGSVKTLDAADTVLINDQLGSLLAETDGTGERVLRSAAYPYGVARYDNSKETRSYANAPRDRSIGLDLMGARFYAPDLGVWTIGDPILVTDPSRVASEEFATANPYAYANLNPIVGVDSDGNFFHIAVGAALGGVIGGGVEAVRQLTFADGPMDWGRVGAAGVAGGVTGAISAAVPAAGLFSTLGMGGVNGAVSGISERLVVSGGASAGTLRDVAIDAGVGVLSAGLFKGAAALVSKVKAARVAPAAKVAETAAPPAGGPKVGSAGGPGAGKRFAETTKDTAETEAGRRCVFCGRETTRAPGGTQRNTDHAIPKSRGGNNTLDNAQNTCRDCNLDKGMQTTQEYLERLGEGGEG